MCTCCSSQAELKEHVLSKMESLDNANSTLEYFRQKNELLTLEARAVLSSAALVAGDYDCVLAGVYGTCGSVALTWWPATTTASSPASTVREAPQIHVHLKYFSGFNFRSKIIML